MRPATFHDLMMASSAIVGACCLVIILQIIIITKSTIPADVLISDVRVLRSEVSEELKVISQRLSNIEAFVIAHAATSKQTHLESIVPQIHAQAIKKTLEDAKEKRTMSIPLQ